MAFQKYISLFLALGLFVTVAGAAFNVWVDPYRIFGSEDISWVNQSRPFAGERGRIAKLYQAERVHPKGIVVGNSRPEMGLDPTHQCWPKNASPVYNTALPGLRVFYQTRYVQHLMAAGETSVMVFAVDFFDFLKRPEDTDNPYQWPPKKRLDINFQTDAEGKSAPWFRLLKARDYFRAAFSLDSLTDSVFTIARQNGVASGLMSNGFNDADEYYNSIIRTEGVAVLFRQKNKEVMRRLSSHKWGLNQGTEKWSIELESLRRIIDESRRKGISTRLFINPYHAEYLTTIQISGFWALFEEWKYRLVTLAESGGVPIWDFSGFNTYTTENVTEAAAKKEKLKWFWEPAHYRKELGDLMLANMLRDFCPPEVNAPLFGVRLDLANIEDHLSEVRRQKEEYLMANEAVVSRLRKLSEH